MATKKHTFSDSHIQLDVTEPTNVTGNNAYISQKFWTDGSTPSDNMSADGVGNSNKYSWYGNFISCMELDWGNAKGSGDAFTNMTETDINNLLFGKGIKTSDELMQVLCWLFKNRSNAPSPIYSVIWDGNGATTAASGGSSSVTQGETILIPSTNPKREYTLTWDGNGATTAASGGSSKMEYTFSNWWTAAAGGTQVTNTTVPTDNSTYYAHWTAKAITLPTTAPKREYTITWDANNGTGTPSGGTTKVTYTFNKWTSAASGGTNITTSTAATANSTYYAQWTAPTGNLQLPTNTLTRSGYTFKGWATTADAIVENVTTSITLASITENKTYYAVWEVAATTYKYYAGVTDKVSITESDLDKTTTTKPTTLTFGDAPAGNNNYQTFVYPLSWGKPTSMMAGGLDGKNGWFWGTDAGMESLPDGYTAAVAQGGPVTYTVTW